MVKYVHSLCDALVLSKREVCSVSHLITGGYHRALLLKTTRFKILVVTASKAEVDTRVRESVVHPMASKNKDKKNMKAETKALRAKLQEAESRADQATESNRQLEEHLREKARKEADLQEQVKNLTAAFKNSDRMLTGITRMLSCVELLSNYFEHVTVVEFQHTEFGSTLSLEAGGLAFDLVQSKHEALELLVYSADNTEIKLVCTSLPLESNGRIGLDALGQIKLRQEAITPEGRKRLLMLDMQTFRELYQDLTTARRERRGKQLAERCLSHVQTPKTEQPGANLKGRLHASNPHMGPGASATLQDLKGDNVTVLRPERLKPDSLMNFRRLCDPVLPLPADPRGTAGSDRPDVSPLFDTKKTIDQLAPLLRVLPEEFKLRDYRNEVSPDDQ